MSDAWLDYQHALADVEDAQRTKFEATSGRNRWCPNTTSGVNTAGAPVAETPGETSMT